MQLLVSKRKHVTVTKRCTKCSNNHSMAVLTSLYFQHQLSQMATETTYHICAMISKIRQCPQEPATGCHPVTRKVHCTPHTQSQKFLIWWA
jgi:hypothetical protein